VAELSGPLLMVLACLLEQLKADAEPVLRAAQRLRPQHSWLNWELGNVLLGSGRPAEAAGFFRAALVMRPDCSAVHDRLALALFRQGLVEEALQEYRKAIELDPSGRLPHRYNAACAALAAAGDARPSDDRPRAGSRRQALAWLRAELDLWGRRLAAGKAEDRPLAARALKRWLRDRTRRRWTACPRRSARTGGSGGPTSRRCGSGPVEPRRQRPGRDVDLPRRGPSREPGPDDFRSGRHPPDRRRTAERQARHRPSRQCHSEKWT
jgi:hypothetical protein